MARGYWPCLNVHDTVQVRLQTDHCHHGICNRSPKPRWVGFLDMGGSRSAHYTIECPQKHHLGCKNFYHPFSCSIWSNLSDFLFWNFFRPFFQLRVTFDHPKIIRFPLRVKNRKNCRIVDLDSSKEGFWCTECNTKNLSSLRITISEKIKKNRRKMVKNGQNGQKLPFWAGFSWFFQKWCFSESCGFLRCIQCIKTLLLSYLNQHSDNFSDFSS